MEKGSPTINKAVFVAVASKYIHSALSVWYLAAAVKASDLPVESLVIEATIHQSPQKLCEKISDELPFVACFSCYIWNIDFILHTVKLLKIAAPHIKIVLGGPEAEHRACQLLQDNKEIDFISHGEGEGSVATLLNGILYNNYSDILNVSYMADNTYRKSTFVPLTTQPPSPYSEEYFAALNGRIAYIETSRGCPYRCAFCLSGACGKPRWFDMQRAKDEILLLANSGTKTVKFVDRTFNANKAHALEIWRFIAENYYQLNNVCFHFEIAGDILCSESLQVLSAMPQGAIQLEIGLQSLNEITLAAVNRKTNTPVLLQNLVKLIALENMHVHIDLIAGLPYEDIASFAQGFNTAFYLKSNMLQLGFLKILYGSTMEDKTAFPCVHSHSPPYEIVSTPWLNEADVKTVKAAEDALERMYNSQRFILTVDYILKRTNVTPFNLFSSMPKGEYKEDLEDYTEKVFNYLAKLEQINKDELRDIMALDYLAFNSTGKLAKVLQVADPQLKLAVKQLAHEATTAPTQGIKRGVAILYTQNKIAWADYEQQSTVTKRYEVKLKDISLKK